MQLLTSYIRYVFLRKTMFMKTISLCTLGIIALFSFTLLFYGCGKENSGLSGLSPDQEQTASQVSVQSETEAQLAFNDIFDNVMGANNQVGMAGTGVFGRLIAGVNCGQPVERGNGIDSTHCFSVSFTSLASTTFPLKLVIDFGNGCLGNDGHMRYGRIITVYTGRLIEAGKSATTTFDGYKIDSFSISGTHVVTNTTTTGQRQFTVDITNAKINKPSGHNEEWNGHRVINQVDGSATPEWPTDDVFSISGSGYGKAESGNVIFAWQSKITEPLTKKFICPWILQGILNVHRETLPSNSPWVASLDYGTGGCDNIALLTINGRTTQITLH